MIVRGSIDHENPERDGPVIPAWLLWSLLAVVCWGLWAVISKLIGNALTAAQSQALSTLGLLPVMLALTRSKNLSTTGNQRRGRLIAFAAGVLVCGGNVAYYHALNLGGKASTVVPLTALYPLVTVMLALILLRERLNRIQLIGIALSLLAIWLFNVAGLEGMLSGWLAYALLPIVLWGTAGLLQKVSTHHISGELSTLWFLGAFVPVAFVLLWLEPLPQAPQARVWLLAGALGLLFGLGNFAILVAFAGHGKASIIAPLAGLYPVVSVPVAILFLGEKVGGREWLGIMVALASVVALSCEDRASASAVPSRSPL
jgi:uncharacterized membrane protein